MSTIRGKNVNDPFDCGDAANRAEVIMSNIGRGDFFITLASRKSNGDLTELSWSYHTQLGAEWHLRNHDLIPDVIVVEYNFIEKYSPAELDAYGELRAHLNKEAKRLQVQALQRTRANMENPEWHPCEVCGEKHRNYHCCDQCNYGTHHCHFCGDDLGHGEMSECYILDGMD